MWKDLLSFFTVNTPPPGVILTAGPPLLLWAYACLRFSGQLRTARGVRTGYTRKVFHLLTFLTAAAIHQLFGLPLLCLFGGMTTLVLGYALVRGSGHPLYEALARESDAPWRTYYIVVPYLATLAGGLASSYLAGPIAVVGLLVGGLGDAAGEPAGARWGKHRYTVPTLSRVKSTRSLEGSLAVFLVSVLAIALGVAVAPELEFASRSLFLIPALGLASALLEAVSPHGWDNATMQIGPSLLAWTFL